MLREYCGVVPGESPPPRVIFLLKAIFVKICLMTIYIYLLFTQSVVKITSNINMFFENYGSMKLMNILDSVYTNTPTWI